MQSSTLTSASRTSDDADQDVESWEFLQPDPKFERALRYAKGTTSRIWLFYHAAHLEAFGRTAPYRGISDEAIERVCAILGEDVPSSFKNPEDRRTFTHHADKARQALDWRRPERKLRSEVQEWLCTQAERSDDHDYLHEVLEERLRFDRIVFPATTTLERMVAQARTEGQERIIRSITSDLQKRHDDAIAGLRKLKLGTHRTRLQWVKEPPGNASPNTLTDLLNRIDFVRGMRLPTAGFETIHPDMRRRMAATVQVYSVDRLFSDFAADRRRAYVTCYLHERLQALIDLAVEAFDVVAVGMYRRSEAERDEHVRRSAPATNEKLHMFRTETAIVLDPEISDSDVRRAIFEKIPKEELAAALAETDDLVRPDDFNCFDYLKRRYTYLRKFFPAFLRTIEFEGTADANPILDAVRAVRYWNAEGIRKVPTSAPVEFVPQKWRDYVCPPGEPVDRHYYELCVLNQLQSAIQSCDMWAVGGRRYGNAEDLLIPKDEWEQIRDQCYEELQLPMDPQQWIDASLAKLKAQIESTTKNFDSNEQVFVENGRVHLTSIDAAELPERVIKLKERVASSWPQVRIQDLLIEVDGWVNFTRFFRTLRGRRASTDDFVKGVFAALIAKGCNIGMTKMAALTPDIKPGTLNNISELYLYEDTLRRVIEHFVTTTHSLPIAHLFGDEKVSMSDGMRIRTRVKSMNAAFMPKHFAPGQRAITYYWHVSHQGPGYAAQVFGNHRDAAYVLDHVFHIRSELPIQEHYTDTHGVTENVFALAEAFGLQFAPRIKRLHAQQLYYPPGMKVTGPFKEHFAGAVDVNLIKEQWDEYVRILASISRGVTSVVLLSQRLSSYAEKNPLYRVIREAGRIPKTRHILRVYNDPKYRRAINSGLDRVENFNYLGRHIFFARRGENWEREFEEQLNRASSLMIIANTCVLWNAVHLTELYHQLVAEGFDFKPEDFLHVSPYPHEHIIPYGQYFFNTRRKDRKNAFSDAQTL